MLFIPNVDKVKQNSNKLFNNTLASLALSLSILVSQGNAVTTNNPIDFKPYFFENGDVKLQAIYDKTNLSFDPKVSIPFLLEKENQKLITKNVALIEQILKDVKDFEKKYDIKQIDYPNVKTLSNQLNVIFNSNLKDLVKDEQLQYSKLYLKYEKDTKTKEFDTPNGKQSLNDIMSIAEDEVLNLIGEYNSKVININSTAADVTYGYTPENVGQEDFGEYKPNPNKVKEIENLIVKNDFDQTLNNLFNNSEKLKLFTPGELNQISDYLELKKSLVQLKDLKNVDSNTISILENDLNTLEKTLNNKISIEFKNIYFIDLNKELYIEDTHSFSER